MSSIVGEKPKYRNVVTRKHGLVWKNASFGTKLLFAPWTLLDMSKGTTSTTGELTPPPGYILVAMEDEKRRFNNPTNLAFGANGNFRYKANSIGDIYFSTSAFGGDPAPHIVKGGFAEVNSVNRAEVTAMANSQAISTNVKDVLAPSDTLGASSSADAGKSNKTLIYVGIGAGVILVGVLVFLMIRKNK